MDANPIAAARQLIDANQYVTLATADADGRPWASPVWFAHKGYTEFVWLSRPEAQHSRNIAQRSEVGFVIFDSTVPPLTGKAVYAEALAQEVEESDVPEALATFNAREAAVGIGRLGLGDVTGDGNFRLHRARATQLYYLDDHDHRVPFDPGA
ncbi:pyridoxamine 5'-phosphate oxidase family protein [Luteipulveratus mongoliensis]|uniref:Pyridoxamine 5'-phosphate oxidase N-terminal domain-containing protein n=1 Tax=Luteipulveratus mongoliensis TaxID=571913 RepID=A0A0K1JDD9_9MICO|nr:pyridoxamine 5'-phosphate oxidase family protein [Luteipulveratus mongoliensis]AKU14717.1 hypothetical protein VV02_00570 [Luteipulveratus mongoliensis]